ncbi:DUF4377 domain-containing protein [Aquiflexum lacus]|uniref:DUF4377 domain-containing protein n=1 Tax=Aquiflexum lacus TaxID=2483805 RepID=UPI0018949039|nr:DUF4377 domain-containing protein [Aquiflexum lacus]
MKSILQLVYILISFCMLLGCKQDEEIPFNLERFWVFGDMIPCNQDPGAKLCYLISKTDSFEDAQWEMLENSIEGFQLDQGYFTLLEVKINTIPRQTPSMPPIITYQLNKTLAKVKDESYKLNGLWKLKDLPGFEEKELIEKFPKYLSYIPLVRFILTSYECNSAHIKLENITDNEIAFSVINVTQKFCHGDLMDYSKSVDNEFIF